MRRRERRGENEFKGTGWERRSFSFSRVVAWKFEGKLRFVIRSVFEGGEGVISGGTEERSRERGVWVPFDKGGEELEGEERGGELVAIVVCDGGCVLDFS